MGLVLDLNKQMYCLIVKIVVVYFPGLGRDKDTGFF